MTNLPIMAFTLICVLANPTFAQQKKEPKRTGTPQEQATQEAIKMAKDLELNPTQQEQWQAAASIRIQKIQPLRQRLQGSTTPEERKQIQSEMKAIKTEFEQTVSRFLTPAQIAKWEEMKKHHKEKKLHFKHETAY